MQKIRKHTQLSLLNPKRAGRPSIHDRGIRHIERDEILRPTSLHLTIKVRENKAQIKSKQVLRALHHAIMRARYKGLKIIHYTLEHNHIHLLVEASDKRTVHLGMQALGISLSKRINKIKCLKGTVYKHRYHLRKITSPRELKNVLHYIFNNGIHHSRTQSILDPYNSLPVCNHLHALYGPHSRKIQADIQNSDFLSRLKDTLMDVLDVEKIFFRDLNFIR